VHLVGNTVIDALFDGLERVKKDPSLSQPFNFLDEHKKMILITGHRRESFGKPFEDICTAIAAIAEKNPEVQLVYPVHLNPRVQKPVNDILSGLPNVFLLEPVDYPSMIRLMSACYFVLTDSGGIQEEAPSLGKPVLVMRNVTERVEGIEAGTALLVGTDKHEIISKSQQLLDDQALYLSMASAKNPYGDGTSSRQIVRILKEYL
jgi:UDP-N-acetylglucosamine 2-epimerase (non-hydrolysing)